MIATLGTVLPAFKGITRSRKETILNNFEEVVYAGNTQTVLEREGSMPRFVYWIISGEILLYKKLDILYKKTDVNEETELKLLKMSGVKALDLFHNPKDGLNSGLGVCIGSVADKNTLVGEEATLSEQLMRYTLVAGRDLVVFRYPVNFARQGWHAETQRILARDATDKYKWVNERICRLE